MKETEYRIGDFLYGIPSGKEPEMYNPTDKRVQDLEISCGEVMCERRPDKKSMILWPN